MVAAALTFMAIISGCALSPTPPDPPPGQTLDADGDGVADADDQCPNTPDGATVDATGCPVSSVDSDGDGVVDDNDNCPDTPSNVTVDENGCPVSAPGTPDTDGDGVNNDIDQCPNTAPDAQVDANGCAPSQLDTDEDGVTNDLDLCPGTDTGATVDNVGCAENQLDTDRDGVFDDADDCPDTQPGTRVDEFGCPVTNGGGSTDPVCGNGDIEDGEQCEPPNTDVCDASCQIITEGTFDADACENAGPILGTGAFGFDNTDATQDGPPHRECINVGQDNIDADMWACWTAPCSATAFVQTCGLTAVDTKIAVYEGCDCTALTDANLLSCNDDRCDTQSIATFTAQAGRQYLIRVGTFPGEAGGVGAVNITCGLTACAVTSGSCDAAHAGAGCSDVGCCETVCSIDSYCCETEWDDVCVNESAGLCSGSFAACGRGAGACTEGNGTAGCESTDCCNTVCMEDPYCCLNEWDDLCADEEAEYCRSSCGDGAGDCFATEGNGSPGCESPDCCAEVCARDAYCCRTEWDTTCAEKAAQYCSPQP